MSTSPGPLGGALAKNDDSAFRLLGSPRGLQIGDVTYKPRTWQVADPLIVSEGSGSSAGHESTALVRVEREPITDANMPNATHGPAISEEEHEVVLTEGRPVVRKEAVPVERVRLDKDAVTEDVQVTEEVRKEQIDLHGAGDDRYPDDVGHRRSVEDTAHGPRFGW